MRYSAYERLMGQQARAEKFNGRIIDDTLLREMQAAYADVQTQESKRVTDGGGVVASTIMTTTAPDGEAEAQRLIQLHQQYKAIYDYVRELVGGEKVHTVDAASFTKRDSRW